MAFTGRIPSRFSVFIRIVNFGHLKNTNCPKVSTIQAANLTTLPTNQNNVKPWPYETRPYKEYHQYWESTSKRFDENTKVIVVDGNIAVGKSEFCERLAKEFNMKYFPDLEVDKTFRHYYTDGSFLDLREFNVQLPPKLRYYDLDQFFRTDENPKKYCQIARTQLTMFTDRLHQYAEIMSHLLNTGQGVVIERGVMSDMVFAETLAKLGYMSRNGLNYYNRLRKYTLCEMPRPHVVIYMDAPVSYVREKITQRNVPYEVNSKVLTDQYIKTIDDVYKDKYLPEARRYGKVLEVDVSQEVDWDVLVEELEALDLEPENEEDYEELFMHWNITEEEDWNCLRLFMGDHVEISNLWNIEPPYDAPELIIAGMDYAQLQTIVEKDIKVKYEKKYHNHPTISVEDVRN